MSDPLIDRYRASFPQHPARRTHEPLDDSKLRKLSEQIQWTGKHPGTPMPSGATVRFATLADPQDWVLPRQAPTSMQQQFQVLKRRELERLAKIASEPVSLQVPQSAALPSPAPSSMQQQLEVLGRQERARWDKIVDELWRAEQTEYDILWQLYERMVTEEYVQLATPNASWSAAYKEFEERGGLDLYRSLRPIYYRAGVRQPHKFIMQMVSSNVRLGGVEVRQGVHPKFAKILERVDRSINRSVIAQFGIQPVRYIGCFRPSPLGDRISNHMIGAAIDIDATIKSADRNPHLKRPQLEALDEMLAFRFKEASQNPNPLVAPGPKLTASGSWLAGVPNLDAIDRARALHAQTVAISKEAKAFLDEFSINGSPSRRVRARALVRGAR
jgi:hypothetical protein